jgi:hypothetical protein
LEKWDDLLLLHLSFDLELPQPTICVFGTKVYHNPLSDVKYSIGHYFHRVLNFADLVERT